ncbi:MAG: ribosomal-protein-alanine N-acetyltransferase [Ruminococcaceae bacterium]|nr:ribosomal-protein-alanine N-acetyltransferase [Oscillospiraceae bacterium]
MEIIPLVKELCESASKLEKNYLSTAWSENQLAQIIENPVYFYVTALEKGTLCGVGGVICTSIDSAEIFTVAVDEKCRGKGIGGKILSSLIEFCNSKNAESIFLEVEEGNHSAIGLYEKFGFSAVGVRKGFYHGKNAIIMRKEL